jgi:hypothetical protein
LMGFSWSENFVAGMMLCLILELNGHSSVSKGHLEVAKRYFIDNQS